MNIEEQWKQDVFDYGDDAYLMWEYSKISGCWRCLSDNNDFNIESINTYRRKTSGE